MLPLERELLFTAARDVLLAAMPETWAIYVYGSFARDEEWPTSDLDLAVLLPPAQDIPDFFGLLGEIYQRTHRDADVVNLRKVGDVLRREVLVDGRSLYVRYPQAVLGWEGTAMSSYARHREEIHDILEDFRRTGIGYAR